MGYCTLSQVLARGAFLLYKGVLRVAGYRIVIACSPEEQEIAYRIRSTVYLEEGYIRAEQAVRGFRDAFEHHSVIWLAWQHGKAVGTIRVTPLQEKQSPVFAYTGGIEQDLEELLDTGAEIGRFAILPAYRGGLLSTGLLFTAYTWALTHGYDHLLWGGPVAIYRWLKRFIPGTRLLDVQIQAYAKREMAGYFRKHRRVGVYIAPLCTVRIGTAVRDLWTRVVRGSMSRHADMERAISPTR